ncbi:MAG: hypothetical protein ACE5F2_02715 [Candidatus Paceibacteria bacterium]
MIYLEIFLIAFLLNFVWEVWHSQLYKTIHEMNFGDIIRLLTKMSLKDGLWIALFYYITVLLFGNINIFEDYTQLGVFIIISLSFSFIDEKVSLKMRRWEYTKNMPTIAGVGITPFLEVAVTGTLAFVVVFLFI